MKRHVLSLDGGGVRCLLQAQILNDLYPGMSGREILKTFDVVTGCSAGSVVLAGLLSDMSPYAIFESFMTPSFLDAIFSRTFWPIFPKWSTKRKREGLLRVLPKSDRYLSEISRDMDGLRILIPTFDVQSRKAHIFDSLDPKHITLLDAVHASSTAPVAYFDKPAAVGDRTYWDGGVSGLNNPAAYGTAIAKEMYPADDICTLSLGSGLMITSADLNLTHSAFYPGLVGSCKNLLSALVDDAPDVSTRYLWTMTNGAYIRINPVIGPAQKGTFYELPEVYYTDHLLGGKAGYADLSGTKLDAKDTLTRERLAAIGMYYLQDKIPSQTVSGMDDLNALSLDSMYYSRLRTKWTTYQK